MGDATQEYLIFIVLMYHYPSLVVNASKFYYSQVLGKKSDLIPLLRTTAALPAPTWKIPGFQVGPRQM